MKRWERWWFNALNGAVAITGLVYFCMKYLLETDDPFAIVNHPWQGSMLALHVVAAPGLVMLFGVIYKTHILKKLASKRRDNRRTGWVSLVSFSVMAASGYLLQVAATAFWINTMIVLHVVTSVVFVLSYSVHLVIRWRLLRAPRTVPANPSLSSTAQLPL